MAVERSGREWKWSERGRSARVEGADKATASDQVECPSDNGVHAATVYGRRQRRASERRVADRRARLGLKSEFRLITYTCLTGSRN